MVGQPILSLIDVVSKEIKNRNLKTVALLGSPTTISSKLFHDKLPNVDEVLCLDHKGQQETDKLIRLVISNQTKTATTRLNAQVGLFKVPVILGCTELSVTAESTVLTNIIDPLELVVNEVFLK